jgi:hypothetical protein
MAKSSIATAAILAIAASALMPLSSQAGGRVHFNYFYYDPGYRTYYPGPLYVPRPRYYYYYDYNDEPPYAYNYEPDYYDPQVDEPQYQPRRYRRPSQPYVAPTQQHKTVTYDKPADTYDEPAATDVQPEPAQPAPVKKKAAGISCAKAAKIVADYGFASVKAANCTGLVYSFKGNRDGKSYSIKLSAKSGELTEVKKL